jgi:hypothetical protein
MFRGARIATMVATALWLVASALAQSSVTVSSGGVSVQVRKADDLYDKSET